MLLIAFVRQCGKRLNWAMRTNNANNDWSQILSRCLAEIVLKVERFCVLTNAKGWELWNFTTRTDGRRINAVDKTQNCSQVWDDDLNFYELINSFQFELFDFGNKMMWSDVIVLLIFKFANNSCAMRLEPPCPTYFSFSPLRTKKNLKARRRISTQIAQLDEVQFNE